jgi:hypothetical protein
LQHQLVALILCARIQVLPLKLSEASLCLLLVLFAHELLLRQTSLFRLEPLLLLKVALCLHLLLLLLLLGFFPLPLQPLLLCLIFLLLPTLIVFPKLVDRFGVD